MEAHFSEINSLSTKCFNSSFCIIYLETVEVQI